MDRQIVFTYGSRTQFYPGRARNHSRFSLYFESHTPLVPGTLLFIRTVGDDSTAATVSDAEEDRSTPAGPDDSHRITQACSELKSQVVAQVRRCVEITGSGYTVYGTGVEFVSPAV